MSAPRPTSEQQEFVHLLRQNFGNELNVPREKDALIPESYHAH